MKQDNQQSIDTHDYHDIGAGHIAIIVFMTSILVMTFTVAFMGWALFA